MTNRGVLLVVLLGLIGLGMFLGIAAMVLPSRSIPDEVLASVLIAGVCVLGVLVAVTVGGPTPATRTACIALGVAASAGFAGVIWLDGVIPWPAHAWLARGSGIGLICSLTLLHRMALLRIRPRSGLGRAARRIALLAAAASAALIVAWLLLEGSVGGRFESLVLRGFGVGLIVAAGGSIAAGLVRLFEPRPEDEQPGLLAGGVPVEVTCPRCGSGVRAESGREVRCDGCRLRVRVEVEEPRCACGYLLYQLTGDRCPECGRAVSEADRWAAPAG